MTIVKHNIPKGELGLDAIPWRDILAALAMVGELACQSPEVGEYTDKCLPLLRKRCYLIADAMLTEPEKGKDDGN